MQIYCMRLCFPIFHGNSCDRKKAHCHTIEITAYIQKENENFDPFMELERRVNRYFDRYVNQFLNEMPEFQGNASMENMGEVFFAGLSDTLKNEGLTLNRLEVGETPLRQYIIGIIN